MPKVKNCCFCVPFYPGVLIYGVFRLIITILISVIYIALHFKYNFLLDETPIVIPVVVQIILIIDVLTIIFLFYNYYTKTDWRFLEKHLPYIMYTQPIKGIVFLIISFFPHPIIAIPYSVLLILDVYILTLIGIKMTQLEQTEPHWGFANKCFEHDVKIEVVEDTIPDIYKNKVYLISDKYIEEVIEKNRVSQENKAQKNKDGQGLESKDKDEPIPTVTHI